MKKVDFWGGGTKYKYFLVYILADEYSEPKKTLNIFSTLYLEPQKYLEPQEVHGNLAVTNGEVLSKYYTYLPASHVRCPKSRWTNGSTARLL